MLHLLPTLVCCWLQFNQCHSSETKNESCKKDKSACCKYVQLYISTTCIEVHPLPYQKLPNIRAGYLCRSGKHGSGQTSDAVWRVVEVHAKGVLHINIVNQKISCKSKTSSLYARNILCVSNGARYKPGLAVDGDLNTCSFTSRKTGSRWWQVCPADFFGRNSCR